MQSVSHKAEKVKQPSTSKPVDPQAMGCFGKLKYAVLSVGKVKKTPSFKPVDPVLDPVDHEPVVSVAPVVAHETLEDHEAEAEITPDEMETGNFKDYELEVAEEKREPAAFEQVEVDVDQVEHIEVVNEVAIVLAKEEASVMENTEMENHDYNAQVINCTMIVVYVPKENEDMHEDQHEAAMAQARYEIERLKSQNVLEKNQHETAMAEAHYEIERLKFQNVVEKKEYKQLAYKKFSEVIDRHELENQERDDICQDQLDRILFLEEEIEDLGDENRQVDRILDLEDQVRDMGNELDDIYDQKQRLCDENRLLRQVNDQSYQYRMDLNAATVGTDGNNTPVFNPFNTSPCTTNPSASTNINPPRAPPGFATQPTNPSASVMMIPPRAPPGL